MRKHMQSMEEKNRRLECDIVHRKSLMIEFIDFVFTNTVITLADLDQVAEDSRGMFCFERMTKAEYRRGKNIARVLIMMRDADRRPAQTRAIRAQADAMLEAIVKRQKGNT